jgi:hypothetical protein
VQQEQLIPGDVIDIAFTLDHNDHPEFGGLELSLRDFAVRCKTAPKTPVHPTESSVNMR